MFYLFRPIEDRAALKLQLYHLPEELGDEWFHVQIIARLGTPADMDTIDFQRAIWEWSWEVLLAGNQAEYIHGRNRQRAHFAQSWQHFCAISANSENMLRLASQQKAIRLSQGQPLRLKASAREPKESKPKRFRRTTVRDLAKEDVQDNFDDLGQSAPITSQTYADAVRMRLEDIEKNPRRLLSITTLRPKIRMNARRNVQRRK